VKPKAKNFALPTYFHIVGIATGYDLDDPGVGVSSPGGIKNFRFSMPSIPSLGSTQSPIQWISVASSPGIKRPGREAGRSPPTRAEVKKTFIYTSTPPYLYIYLTYFHNILPLKNCICFEDLLPHVITETCIKRR
jgi:hypothetical protein